MTINPDELMSALKKSLLDQYSTEVLSTQLFTSGDVARMLRVSPATVKRWADSGRIRTTRSPGKHRRMLLSDVAQFVLENPKRVKAPYVQTLLQPNETEVTQE